MTVDDTLTADDLRILAAAKSRNIPAPLRRMAFLRTAGETWRAIRVGQSFRFFKKLPDHYKPQEVPPVGGQRPQPEEALDGGP